MKRYMSSLLSFGLAAFVSIGCGGGDAGIDEGIDPIDDPIVIEGDDMAAPDDGAMTEKDADAGGVVVPPVTIDDPTPEEPIEEIDVPIEEAPAPEADDQQTP